MRNSHIGGQAVIEGVMMRHGEDVAVAVRRPDGEIEVAKSKYENITRKHKILGFPIIRGVVAFINSLVLGIRTLTYSATFYEDDIENEEGITDRVVDETFKSKGESAVMVFTIVIALVIAVALFIILPYFISELILKYTHITSATLLALIEGFVKLFIFIAYIAVISQMKDIKRTFMYHGAEHKCINCLEDGHVLTVNNVMRCSKVHRRCGTSFIVFVLVLSIILFIFIRVDELWLRLVVRILLIPVIAGLSFEFIQWAGNSNSFLAKLLIAPGLWVQAMTTKEPTRDMVEVAIASVDAVFDWRGYLTGERVSSAEDIEEDFFVSGRDFAEAEAEIRALNDGADIHGRKSIKDVVAPSKESEQPSEYGKADRDTVSWL